jgi:hypothetical protein
VLSAAVRRIWNMTMSFPFLKGEVIRHATFSFFARHVIVRKVEI